AERPSSGTRTGVSPLTITGLPSFTYPQVSEFLWAIGFGIGAAVVGSSLRWLALLVCPHVERRPVLMTTMAGLGVAVLAIIYSQVTGKAPADVLFSGEDSLPTLIQSADTYTVGTVMLLIVCKGLAYSISLGGFRGGPVFPSMFIGAA